MGAPERLAAELSVDLPLRPVLHEEELAFLETFFRPKTQREQRHIVLPPQNPRESYLWPRHATTWKMERLTAARELEHFLEGPYRHLVYSLFRAQGVSLIAGVHPLPASEEHPWGALVVASVDRMGAYRLTYEQGEKKAQPPVLYPISAWELFQYPDQPFAFLATLYSAFLEAADEVRNQRESR